MNVLVLTDYYLPGWKAGGVVRSLRNLVELLGDKIRFRVITGDRDFGETGPYPGIGPGRWQTVGKAEVRYLAAAERSLRNWTRLLTETPHDLLYLNSFFSPDFAVKPLLLRRLNRVPRLPALLAPKGELSEGALFIKKLKKRLYLKVGLPMGLYRGLAWQASGPLESEEIARLLGSSVEDPQSPIFVAEDPVMAAGQAAGGEGPRKEAGLLRAVFLSRISRKKNLDGALAVLAKVKARVQLDVYGPLEDPAYWEECRRLAGALPENIGFTYRGPIAPDQIHRVLSGYDAFFLPTLGENFGHVIIEALLAGSPVVISDTTPWRDLAAKGAGVDLPLHRQDLFVQALEELAGLDAEKHAALSKGARAFGERIVELQSKRTVEQHLEMFERVSARRPPHP
jgi:glycosyltransferase involved in cell wall biosynthesis